MPRSQLKEGPLWCLILPKYEFSNRRRTCNPPIQRPKPLIEENYNQEELDFQKLAPKRHLKVPCPKKA